MSHLYKLSFSFFDEIIFEELNILSILIFSNFIFESFFIWGDGDECSFFDIDKSLLIGGFIITLHMNKEKIK